MVNKNIIFLVLSICCIVRGYSQDQHFNTPLPIVSIDTYGKVIPDDPKIPAHMNIFWNEETGLNSTKDSIYHYNGNISIEVRGSTSQSFPKKSYGFETKDENGNDVDFPLLGFPPEEDWILHGPYSDKSLIRNALAFTLARELGHYSSRIKFVELFINNTYHGIYLFMEKIKRDASRLDIKKLNPHETEGSDLTGGYIVKIDKTTGSGGPGWQSQFLNRDGTRTFYQYEVPASDEIVKEQKEYIQTFIHAFEKSVVKKKHSGTGSYHDFIDASSFIDFILINEISKNVDAYRLSTFLHKDKKGKLKAGPYWDFNLAFGNADYYDGWKTTGLQLENRFGGDIVGVPFWWNGLRGDTVFINDLRCRWNSLRKERWSTEKLHWLTDSLVSVLDGAEERNFQKWPVMGKYIWPNFHVATSHEEEIVWISEWLRKRVNWLDENLPGKCITSSPPIIYPFEVQIYPNPVSSVVNLHINSEEDLKLSFHLFHINGTLVKKQELNVIQGEQEITIDVENLQQGVYLYTIFKAGALYQKGKIVKL